MSAPDRATIGHGVRSGTGPSRIPGLPRGAAGLRQPEISNRP
jgi:hypothetical protein